MIHAVIFDLDDTLYSFRTAHAAAMERVSDYAWENLGIPQEAFPAEDTRQIEGLRRRLGEQSAIHNRLLRYLRMLETRKAPLEHAVIMERLYWHTLLDAMVPEPGAVECLAELHRAGFRVGIGTNMTADWQMEKLIRLDMLKNVDFVVTSEEAGADKPDPRMFALCAQKAGVPAANCLFVGDNRELDYLGAKAAGMQALWYAPGVTPSIPESVDSFARLTRMLLPKK